MLPSPPEAIFPPELFPAIKLLCESGLRPPPPDAAAQVKPPVYLIVSVKNIR